jgi:hypothetical protein
MHLQVREKEPGGHFSSFIGGRDSSGLVNLIGITTSDSCQEENQMDGSAISCRCEPDILNYSFLPSIFKTIQIPSFLGVSLL